MPLSTGVMEVECDMSQPYHIITKVHHDSEDRLYVTGHQDPGSYLRMLHYHGSSEQQLRALSEASEHCQQHVKVHKESLFTYHLGNENLPVQGADSPDLIESNGIYGALFDFLDKHS